MVLSGSAGAKQLSLPGCRFDSLVIMGNKLCRRNTPLSHRESLRKTLNEFILEVTKSLFQEIDNPDLLIIKIMRYAQTLVDADRAGLFLLDEKTQELYAKFFDLGQTKEIMNQRSTGDSSSQLNLEEIRFPITRGVAGYVARTGKVLNIQDAYKDRRFLSDIDIRTGYKTRNILCMPIFLQNTLIGVMEMVNKRHGNFTKTDERSFELFAVYCGLALYHADLYEKIKQSERKYRVALDILSYHCQATAEEVRLYSFRALPLFLPSLNRFDFSPYSVEEDNTIVYSLYMFKKLLKSLRYDPEDVIRFTLTVRKNYRTVPFHNWSHAFSVAHSMFVIINCTKHQLTPEEGLGLFVSCLCHDVDHRGKTNQFMVVTASPLAALYSTSVMEQHHFHHTISILQSEGHNIFKYMTSDQYKIMLSNIKRFILATDLDRYLNNKIAFEQILSSEKFSWAIIHHRQLLQSLLMTACDLCANFKPWDIHVARVYVIMEEFWNQGDEEKLAGLKPSDLMDRERKSELPIHEINFISNICIPCYSLVSIVMPDTKPMLDGCRMNLQRWRRLHNYQGTEV